MIPCDKVRYLATLSAWLPDINVVYSLETIFWLNFILRRNFSFQGEFLPYLEL